MTMKAEITERILTEVSRKRALTEEEGHVLECAIIEQVKHTRTRDGRRYPVRQGRA